MKATKIAVLPAILFAFLMLGGCATSTISAFHGVSPSESNKVTISSLVVTRKDMKTNPTPDATEKVVADEVFLSLSENLKRKNLLADQTASFRLDLQVFYYKNTLLEWMAGEGAARGAIHGLIVRGAVSKKNGPVVAQIDSMDGTGLLISYKNLTSSVTEELANQIEKILKEGVSVGKSP